MSENFKPYISANENLPEFSVPALVLGAILAVLFGAANAYLGLRMGQTVAASIPAAVISMCVLRVILRRSSILENNIVQTIASAGEALAAGTIFTIPAWFYWAHEGKIPMPNVASITVIAMCGGFLGVLFMIPLRYALIVKEHETLPYPEGTACAQVLLAGEKGASNGRPLFIGIGLAALFKFITGMLKVVPEELWLKFKSLHTACAVDLSAAFISVGYICGLQVGCYMVAGALIGWFVLIPAITFFGADAIIFPSKVTIAALYAEGGATAIWSSYIRYIGAGGVAVAGLFSLTKNVPMLISTFKQAITGIKTTDGGNAAYDRTNDDLSAKIIIVATVIIAAALCLTPFVPMTILPVVLAIIFGFFFCCVSSRIVGLIGASNNPGSSMTIASLIISIPILKLAGHTGVSAMVTAIALGTIVCSVSAIAADTSQDLKTGFILGATPRKMQLGALYGVFVMSFFIGGILILLDKAWGYGSAQLPAPQATMMKMIVEGMMADQLPWGLICIGGFITVAVALLGIPTLPVAMGMYLPIPLSMTILCGGIIKHITEKIKARKNKDSQEDSASQTGVLFCSGLIAGEGIVGVLMALFAVIGLDEKLDISQNVYLSNPGGIAVFIVMIALVYYAAIKPAKKND